MKKEKRRKKKGSGRRRGGADGTERKKTARSQILACWMSVSVYRFRLNIHS